MWCIFLWLKWTLNLMMLSFHWEIESTHPKHSCLFEEFKTLKRMLQEWTQMLKLAAIGHGNESLWIGSLGTAKRQSHDFATFPPNLPNPFSRFSVLKELCFLVVGYSPSSDFPFEPVVAYLHWLGYVYSFLTFCLLFDRSVASDFVVVQVLSLVPHGLQHARLPCPSPSLKSKLFVYWLNLLLHWQEMASVERITVRTEGPISF